MSRTPRLAPPSASRQRLLPGLLAMALVTVAGTTAACSASPTSDGKLPAYEQSDAVKARVLPQLAANGEDTEAADERRPAA